MIATFAHFIFEKLELMFPIYAFNTVVRSFAENHLKLSTSKSQIFCKFKPIMTMLKTFDLLGDACTYTLVVAIADLKMIRIKIIFK